jgi:hypothetical protein
VSTLPFIILISSMIYFAINFFIFSAIHQAWVTSLPDSVVALFLGFLIVWSCLFKIDVFLYLESFISDFEHNPTWPLMSQSMGQVRLRDKILSIGKHFQKK